MRNWILVVLYEGRNDESASVKSTSRCWNHGSKNSQSKSDGSKLMRSDAGSSDYSALPLSAAGAELKIYVVSAFLVAILALSVHTKKRMYDEKRGMLGWKWGK